MDSCQPRSIQSQRHGCSLHNSGNSHLEMLEICLYMCLKTGPCDSLFCYELQVYPKAWTAIYMALDNVGMWNVRSESWARQYLGQQFYLRVYTSSTSFRDELPIPRNALLCGRASGRHTRPL